MAGVASYAPTYASGIDTQNMPRNWLAKGIFVAAGVERPRRSTRDPLEDDGDAGRVHERDRDRHLGALRALREQRHDVACEDGRQRREDHVRRHGKADDVAGVRLRLCGVLAAELLPDQTGGGEPEAPAGGAFMIPRYAGR